MVQIILVKTRLTIQWLIIGKQGCFQGFCTDSLNNKLVEYVIEKGNDLGFTKYFWKGCEPLQSDIERYRKSVSVLKSASAGLGVSQTARRFGVRHSTVYRWAKLEQMPKLAHYLKAFLKLGVPQPSRVWLTLESSHGYAVPVGQFAHVPTQIKDWSDVQELLIQLQPIERLPSEFDRNYLFGFLLGMIII